jgi:hypothetical protein
VQLPYGNSRMKVQWTLLNIVAYSPHARTVEPQKPQNMVHYTTINETVFSPCCAKPCLTFCYAMLWWTHLGSSESACNSTESCVFRVSGADVTWQQ